MPTSLILTVDKCLASPTLGPIYNDHPYLFTASVDRDYLILLVALLYEHCRGPLSPWFPYLSALDPDDLPCYWPPTTLAYLSDREMQSSLAWMRDDLDFDWTTLR